jgi:uncharacterized protein (TIGR02246 family)
MPTRTLAVASTVLLACSGSPGGGEKHEAGRKELVQIYDDLIRALETKDTAVFSRVVAPDFYGTQDSAKTFGRSDIIRRVNDTTQRYQGLTEEDRQVRIYGNGNVGVITARQRWTFQGGDRPGPWTGRYTEVFLKRDGRWQMVVGHYTDVPPPASQP